MAEHEENGKGKKKHGSHGPGGHGGGDHEEHEGAPEWLISFADNVMLQMGFFVILLALNMKPASSGAGGAPTEEDQDGEQKMPPPSALLDFAIAVRQAFNNPVDMRSTDPRDLPLVRRLIERSVQGEANETGPKGRDTNVRSIRPGDHYSLGGAIGFEMGSAALTEANLHEIEMIAMHIRGRRFIIEVRGHTSAAETFQQVEKGMKLSYDRASAVAAALHRHGVEWKLIRLVACGDADRLTPIAYDTSSHRTNQRVEIIVTSETPPDDPYVKEPPVGGQADAPGQ